MPLLTPSFFKIPCLTLLFIYCWSTGLQAQVERSYVVSASALPEWVQLMYADTPDIGAVTAAKNAYYRTHPFVKTQHTQYYKRWKRRLELLGDASRLSEAEKRATADNELQYLKTFQSAGPDGLPSPEWTCIGPFDFDKGAAATSYAAGAAHLYTVEQAPGNPNVLYAGAANAGLWKSTDKGLHWSLLTRDLLITTVYALEIDHTNADVVYFSGAGKLYKSTDGGATINQIGDAAFRAVPQDIKDIVMSPLSPNILLLASDQGLYRTTDAGNNWTKILPGDCQEIEFKPGAPNTIYVVKAAGNHTEFYKSTDGGLSFVPKAGGYPGISAVTNQVFSAKKFNSTADYVRFASNPNPGNGANADFTMEMWVKSPGWTGDPAIFSNKNWAGGANKGFVLAGRTNGTQWKFNIANGSQRIDMNGGTISDGAWHHIAVVYRAQGQKELYQDGELLTTSATILSGTVNTTLPLVLGQDGTLAYGSGFVGEIAELRFWNTALSSSTLNTWKYEDLSTSHPKYSNLVHYWKLTEGSGMSAADAKGANTGTVFGTAGWSVNNNITFVSSNIPAPDEQKRTEIAVSPAAPNVVYALATGSADGGSGLYGVYKSTDSGETWSFRCCGPGPGGVPSPTNFNLMGWDDGGQDDGGQYYYDLSLGVSPTNPDSVYVCGVNLWESANGGASFSCPSKWSHSGKVNYVHADIHDIKMYPNGDMWLACDGGLFYSNDHGTNWNKRMYGIAGTDFWGFGAGFQDGSVMLGGTYHNGTLLKDGNTYINGWLSTDGGDNTRGYVNPGKPRIAYSDYNKKLLSGNRTIAPATFAFDPKPNTAGNMEFHPSCYNIIYIPTGSQLVRTDDDGASHSLVYDFGNDVTIEAVKVAWANPDVLYVSVNPDFYAAKKLYRSTDAGKSWTDITPANATIGNNTAMPFEITLDGTDPNTLWLALTHPYSWYTADGFKVFTSTDGGNSWSNLSTQTLNGEHIKHIEHLRGSKGGVYIGTHRTVYYRNNTMPDWEICNNQLPALTYCTRLLPYYKGGKLRNASDRSVYESDLFESTPPQAQIAVNGFNASCSRDTFYFASHSAARAGASFAWSFPGGNPVTSTAENPKVTYSKTGTFDVSLTVTDAFGSSSQTIPQLIRIDAADCDPDTLPGKSLNLANPGDYVSCQPLDISSNTLTLMAWIKPNGAQPGFAGILFSGSGDACGLNFRNGNQLGYHWANSAGSYNWAGGPTVSAGEWHHVALVVTPNSATVYLDGIAYSRQATHNAVQFNSPFLIGSDRGNASRNFKGQLDEVCFYNRALSQNEIRELMHLTKNNPHPGNLPTADASLLQYFQFNETSGPRTFDRVGTRHGSLVGNAGRMPSTAPVGGGVSKRLPATAGGWHDFAPARCRMLFPATGTYPNAELVVSRLQAPPDTLPGAFPFGEGYWIVEQFGGNAVFSPLEQLVLEPSGHQMGFASLASHFTLYKRSARNDGFSWGNAQDTADELTGPPANGLSFSTGNGVASVGQLLIQQKASLQAQATAPPIACHGGTTTLTVSGSGGWPPYSGAGTFTVGAGLHSYTLTDARGTTQLASLNLNQPSQLLVAATVTTPAACFGDPVLVQVNASGGTGPYSGTGPQLLPAGWHTFLTTDAQGCTASTQVELTQPKALALLLAASPTSANGLTDGSISTASSGGTAVYSYSWSHGASGPLASGLAPGIYTVTLTDAHGCTVVQSAVVNAYSCTVSGGISATNLRCAEANDGTASAVTASGEAPFAYSWSNGASEPEITNLAAGSYTVTITDAKFCQVVASIDITAPPALNLVLQTATNVACAGEVSGTAQVVASGGTGALVYLWSDGQTGPLAMGLSAGQYTVVVSDEHGCSQAISAVIIQQDTIAPVLAAQNTALALDTNGQIDLTAAALQVSATDNCGLAALSIEPAVLNCEHLGANTVRITAIDSTGNSSSVEIQVQVLDQTAPVLSCPPSLERCAEANVVEFSMPVATDNCPAGGVWLQTQGLASGAIFPTGLSEQRFRFTDAGGNVDSCSFTITVFPALVLGVPVVVPAGGGQSDGAIGITCSGGVPPYAFAWTRDGALVDTAQNLSQAAAGLYMLLVTDAKGCTTQSESIEIGTVGVQAPAWLAGVRILPNPSSGKTWVELPNRQVKLLRIQVTDMSGRVWQT
ncbi:MAG: HYR domain-containing protein, partial [Saprospiraceae bacterium]|nr:HYR domain-containing protein [Saprospiraceae bacterium]